MQQILKNKTINKTHILNTVVTPDGEIHARKVNCGKINVFNIDYSKYEIIEYDEKKVNCQQCLRFKSIIFYRKDHIS